MRKEGFSFSFNDPDLILVDPHGQEDFGECSTFLSDLDRIQL
jgi:hypothetical protein